KVVARRHPDGASLRGVLPVERHLPGQSGQGQRREPARQPRAALAGRHPLYLPDRRELHARHPRQRLRSHPGRPLGLRVRLRRRGLRRAVHPDGGPPELLPAAAVAQPRAGLPLHGRLFSRLEPGPGAALRALLSGRLELAPAVQVAAGLPEGQHRHPDRRQQRAAVQRRIHDPPRLRPQGGDLHRHRSGMGPRHRGGHQDRPLDPSIRDGGRVKMELAVWTDSNRLWNQAQPEKGRELRRVQLLRRLVLLAEEAGTMVQGKEVWGAAGILTVLRGVGGTAGAQTPAPARATPASNGRVAIVDIQRILARSVAGAAAREQLEKDKATMQRQLDGHKTELEKMRDELEKKGQLLSADARREKQDALDRKVRDVRRLVDDLQAQLQKKEDALLQKGLQDVAGLIQRLGKEKGYAVVLERQRAGVLYASGDSDLTED